MKKLLLFTLLIMFTFSISTVSVSASTDGFTPSSMITNVLGTNGLFDKDSDNNGVADNWDYDNSINGSVNEGTQRVYASGSYSSIGISNTSYTFIQNHIYYTQYNFETNSADYDSYIVITNAVSHYELGNSNGETGIIYGSIDIDETAPTTGFSFVLKEEFVINDSVYFEVSEMIIVDLTATFGSTNEPTADEFHNMLKVDYFSNTTTADEIIDFDNNTRVDHYMYEMPNIFEDFPNNITMENIIRIAFYIPLMIIYFIIIPLFNFVLGGSASGYVLFGLLILAFILREIIRFIDPDFHLFGKNSYYSGFKRPPKI